MVRVRTFGKACVLTFCFDLRLLSVSVSEPGLPLGRLRINLLSLDLGLVFVGWDAGRRTGLGCSGGSISCASRIGSMIRTAASH